MYVVFACSSLSHVQLFATLWTIACQAPLSMGLSRKEYWNGLPCPPTGDLPDPGIKPNPGLVCLLSAGKESACNEGDPALIPGQETPLEKG